MTDDAQRQRVANAINEAINKKLVNGTWPHKTNDGFSDIADAAIKAMEEPEEVSVVEQIAEALADAEVWQVSLTREDKIRIGIQAIREGAPKRLKGFLPLYTIKDAEEQDVALDQILDAILGKE